MKDSAPHFLIFNSFICQGKRSCKVHAKPLIDSSAVSSSVTIQVVPLNLYYLDKCDLDLHYLYTFRKASVYLAFLSMFLQQSSCSLFSVLSIHSLFSLFLSLKSPARAC